MDVKGLRIRKAEMIWVKQGEEYCSYSYCNVKVGGGVACDTVSIPWAQWGGASGKAKITFPIFTKPL